MSAYAREMAKNAADALTRSLARNTGEVPKDEALAYLEYVGRSAAFEAGVEYAIEVLTKIANEADRLPGHDDLEAA